MLPIWARVPPMRFSTLTNRCVLHRDIKPGNLMLDRYNHAWVADFGLAKMRDTANLTLTQNLIGTLRYTPPEQFEGRADARSDVYSLGLTLYELCTMRPAFSAEDRAQLMNQVLNEIPTAPEPIRSQYSNRFGTSDSKKRSRPSPSVGISPPKHSIVTCKIFWRTCRSLRDGKRGSNTCGAGVGAILAKLCWRRPPFAC